MEANRWRIDLERDAHARQLSGLRRVLVHAFPAAHPEAVAVIDVAGRETITFIGDEIARAIDRLASYDIIGAVGVRALLRTLHIDPGERRLAELGPSAEDSTAQPTRPDVHHHDDVTRPGLVWDQSSLWR